MATRGKRIREAEGGPVEAPPAKAARIEGPDWSLFMNHHLRADI